MPNDPRVSIPLRQAKNGSASDDQTPATGFQFLLGRLKTIEKNSLTTVISSVSIPLRQAKNGKRLGQSPCGRGFQFLLGRLKTEDAIENQQGR